MAAWTWGQCGLASGGRRDEDNREGYVIGDGYVSCLGCHAMQMRCPQYQCLAVPRATLADGIKKVDNYPIDFWAAAATRHTSCVPD